MYCLTFLEGNVLLFSSKKTALTLQPCFQNVVCHY